MSRSVETRVVEMRFDNKKFESGAEKTLNTLTRLKEALKIQDSSKALDNLGKSAKNIKLDGIAAGVEALNKRFSTMGIVGMTVISNITNALTGKLYSAFNFVQGAIVSGGIRRAMNIENAHFQLQALLKDEAKVQAVMDNAMESVDGTAYAYDEAAKAASQFAASGIEAGEDMLGALKGITGVAAMTNSEYESISNIFTTVAGNGRLMGDQLLQLSSRGLNAASTIADYYKEVQGQASMTEATIRDMVSKGQISFKTFSDAMTWAFGESAERANETFTGAMSNMKSAFARIGAGFVSPLIEQNGELVNLFNAIRIKVNDVKSALVFDEQRSAVSGLAKRTKLANDELSDMFDTIKKNGSVSNTEMTKLEENGANATNALATYINGVISGRVRATYAIKSSLDDLTEGTNVSIKDVKRFVEEGKIDLNTFTSAMEHAYGKEKTLTKQFTDFFLDHIKGVVKAINNTDMTEPMAVFYYWVESAKNVLKGLYSVTKPIGGAFSDVFLAFGIEDVMSFSNAVEKLTSKLKLSSHASDNLHDAFQGVFSVIKLGLDILFKLVGLVVPINEPIIEMSGGILDLAGAMGRGLTTFTEWIRQLSLLKIAYGGVKDLSSWIISGTSGIINATRGFVREANKSVIVQNAIQGLKDILKEFGDVGEKAFLNLTDGIRKFTDKASSWAPRIFTDGITSLIQKFKDLRDLKPGDIGEKIGGFGDSIKSSIGGLIESNEGLSSFVDAVQKFFSDLGEAFSGDTISERLSKVMSTFTEFTNWIKTTFSATFTGFSVGNTIGAGAGMGIIYSLIKMSQAFDKAMGSIKSVPDLLGKVGGAIAAYQQELKSEMLLNIAKAIGILAASLVVLSFVDQNRLQSAAAVLGIVASAILFFASQLASAIADANETTDAATVFAGKIGAAAKKLTGALRGFSFAAVLGAFALCIGVIAASVAGLAKLYAKDADSMMKGVETVSKLAIGLTIAFAALTIINGLFKSEGNAFEGIGKMILSLGGALLVGLYAIKKLLKLKLPDDYDVKFLLLAGILTGLSVLVLALGLASKISGENNLGSTTIIATTLLLSGIISNLGKLFKMNIPDDYGKKLAIFSLIFVEFAAMMIAMGVATRIAGQEMTAGGEILAMTAFITAVTASLLTLQLIPMEKMLKSVLALGLIMAALAIPILAMGKIDSEGAGAAVGAMDKVIAAITASLTVLALIDAKKLLKAVLALGVTLIAFGETFRHMKGIKKNTYVAVMTMMTAMAEIAFVLAALAERPWQNLAAAGLAMSATILAFSESFKIMSQSKKMKWKTIEQFLAATVALVPIATALGVLAGRDWQGMLGAGVGMSLVLLALAESFKIVSESGEMNWKQMGIFLTMTGILAGISVALWFLADKDYVGLIAAAGSLSLVLLAIAKSFKIISEAGEMNWKQMGIFLSSLIVLGGISAALWFLADKDYVGLIAAGVSLSMVLLVMSLAFWITSKAHPDIKAIGMFLAGTVSVLGVMYAIKELANYPVEGLIGAAASLCMVLIGMAVAMAVCALVGNFATAALAGIVAFDAFIANFAGVLWALDKTLGSDEAKEAIQNGSEVLSMLGDALGDFVGSIIGGFLDTLTSYLPSIGKSLSEFMDNLGPFIEGAKDIKKEDMQNVGLLSLVIAALTGDAFVVGISKLFNLSIVDVADELSDFMKKLRPFIFSSKLLKKESVEACAMIGDMIVSLTSGNFIDGVGKMLGLNGGLNKFGEELEDFAPHIGKFANEVKDITPEMVEGAVGAAEIISKLSKNLQGTGGLLQKFTGEKSLADFGRQLVLFGPDLLIFACVVKDITKEMVEGAAAAADIMVELNKKLPGANGFAQKLFGTKSLGDFGSELVRFGNGISSFVNRTVGINEESVKGAAAAGEIMATLAEKLPSAQTMWNKLFGGGKSFSNFGAELESFADRMVGFSNIIVDVNYENMEKFTDLVSQLIDFANESANEETFAGFTSLSMFDMTTATESLEAFVNSIKQQIPLAKANTSSLLLKIIQTLRSRREDFKASGEDAIKKYLEGFTLTPQNKIALTNVIKEFIKAIDDMTSEFEKAGKNAAKGFTKGLSDSSTDAYNAGKAVGSAAEKGAKKALDEQSPSKKMGEVGRFAGLGFVLEFTKFIKEGYDKGLLLGESVANGASDGLSFVQNALSDMTLGDPVIRPIMDISGIRSGAAEISSMFDQAIQASVALAGNANVTMTTRQTQNEIWAKELKGLRSDLGNMSGDTYTINGLQYSEKSDVSDAIRTLIRATNIKQRS